MFLEKLENSKIDIFFKYLFLFVLYYLTFRMLYSSYWVNAHSPFLTDFGEFYHSIKLLQAHHNPYLKVAYWIKIIPYQHISHLKVVGSNLNPPLFLLLIYPLVYLPYAHALLVWTCISLAAGMIGIIFLLYCFKVKEKPIVFLWVYLLFLMYFPTHSTLRYGQVTLCLFPLITGALLAELNKKSFLSAIILGFSASLKWFFGLFVIYYFLMRNVKHLLTFCLCILLFSALPLFISSPSIYSHYLFALKGISWYSASWNASIFGFSVRLFSCQEGNYHLACLPLGYHLIAHFLELVTLILLIIFIKKNSSTLKNSHLIILNYSSILLCSLLLSPLGWCYYFPFVFIFYLFVYFNLDEIRFPYSTAGILAFVFFVGNVFFYYKNPYELTDRFDIWIWSGCYFYCLILSFAFMYWIKFFAFKQEVDGRHHTVPDWQKMLLICIAYYCSLLSLLLYKPHPQHILFSKPIYLLDTHFLSSFK